MDSAPASGETDSINIESSDTDTDEDIELVIPKETKKTNRPGTASAKRLSNINSLKYGNDKRANKTDTSEVIDGGKEKAQGPQQAETIIDNDDSIQTAEDNLNKRFNPSTSYENMIEMDKDEARKSIISAINSYEDDRYPSQGTNYSNPTENARIDQSVASEILNRTIQYEERELYRQYDVMNSHAGNIDNRTNNIIEHISDQLENEYTLPEVSLILEAHMDSAEQRWLAGEYVHYMPDSPPESIADDNEDTLVPSHDVSLEETLTDENVDKMADESGASKMAAIEEVDDYGIGNDVEKSLNDSKNVNDLAKNENENEDFNDSKLYESIIDDDNSNIINESCEGDEVFEDCVDDAVAQNVEKEGSGDFDRLGENLSLEMKLALGSDKNM